MAGLDVRVVASASAGIKKRRIVNGSPCTRPLQEVITRAGPYQIEPYLTVLQPYCHERIPPDLSQFWTLKGDARRDQRANCLHTGLILGIETGEVRAVQIEHGQQASIVDDRHHQF